MRGPVELVLVNEDQIHSTVGPVREIEFRYRVLAPGTATIGPIQVASGKRNGAVPATEVVALAPPSHASAEHKLDVSLFKTPSVLIGEHEVPEVWSDAGRVYVSSQLADRVVFGTLPSALPIKYVFKERGQPKWVVHSWPNPDERQLVDVVRNGELLLRATVDSASEPKVVALPSTAR